MSLLRIVAISDTHLTRPTIPDGDVLIHAGDLCARGTHDEFQSGVAWLGRQPHALKIFVPGNHDRWVFDYRMEAEHSCRERGVTIMVDKTMEYRGFSFRGNPWTPQFGWTKAYMYKPEHAAEYWHDLQYSDVLISHGPPAGILDRCPLPVGCPEMLKAVERTQPRVHIFGHIHPCGGGVRTVEWESGHATTFINACTVRTGYTASELGDPLVFTLERFDGGIRVCFSI